MVRLDCQVPECEIWWLEGTFFRPGRGSRFVLPDIEDFFGYRLRERERKRKEKEEEEGKRGEKSAG